MEDLQQLRIQTFQDPPSPATFTSNIETKNIPAVFRGCVKHWKAFVNWNPSNNGLDYLQERAGSSVVEAMLSTSAPVFYGDIRSHDRVPLPFSTFIGFCKQRFQNADDSAVSSSVDGAPEQIYLAQVPIMNNEDQERIQLETLKDDIEAPTFLGNKEMASINLWMNSAKARSSTHYDPHHNVLCIVSGCKQVVLWPPSASPLLYTMPIYGEASNHSSVPLENPDFSLYPRAKCSMEYSQKLILHAGDALFIPEGWFHQVDSDDLTIAVNFWWRSTVMTSMPEHMDAYYLRRILRRLTDKEMNQVFQKLSSAGAEKPNRMLNTVGADQGCCNLHQVCERKGQGQRVQLQELEPFALQALHELVSLVHTHVNLTDQSQSKESTSASDSATNVENQYAKSRISNLFLLEDDSVAKLISTLDPCDLKGVLLAMVHNFPRTLEALILHMLSPVGAEVLTQKFDGIDQQTPEEDRNKFYQDFYGVFDDQYSAMNAILNGKESFARKAFENVMDKYLGVSIDVPKPSLK